MLDDDNDIGFRYAGNRAEDHIFNIGSVCIGAYLPHCVEDSINEYYGSYTKTRYRLFFETDSSNDFRYALFNGWHESRLAILKD